MTISRELWIIILLMFVFVAYVAAKVYAAAKKSEQQWKNVDRSKLKHWEDEDD